MGQRFNTLCLYGYYNGEKCVISQNLKNVSEAALYTSKFNDEKELIEYIKEKTGITFSNITLEKTYSDPNKSSQKSHIFYKQENMYCTIDNITKMFVELSTNNLFVSRLKNDEYIKASFQYMNNPQNFLRDAPKEKDQRINKGKNNIDSQYINIKRRDMTHFLETALYTSKDKDKRKPKNAILRYLFGEYISKSQLTSLIKKLDLKPKVESFNFEDFEFLSDELIMHIKEPEKKEIRIDEDDLYPINEKFGDGNLDNPDYQEEQYVSPYNDLDEKGIKRPNNLFVVRDDGTRVSIKWYGKDLLIKMDSNTYVMKPTTAFKKWSHDKYMLMALRDFLNDNRNNEAEETKKTSKKR